MKIRVQCGWMHKVIVIRRLGCSIDATVLKCRSICYLFVYLFTSDDILNDAVSVANIL